MISAYDKLMYPGIELMVFYTVVLPVIIAFAVIFAGIAWVKYVNKDRSRRNKK